MTIKTNFRLTASERVMGRLMRAPDHETGGDGGAPSGDGQPPANGGDKAESTAAALEKEFPSLDGEPGEGDFTETEEDIGTAGVGEEGEDEGGEGDADGADGKPEGEDPPLSRAQERFNELTNGMREAQARAAEAERQAEFWRKQAEALPPKPEVAEGEADPDAGPDPANFPFGEADTNYIVAKAKHEAKMEMRAEGERARINAELNEMEAKYQGNVAKALEEMPDYDEVVTKGAAENKWACSPVVALGIRHSDVGTKIAYHLAKNPDESRRIAELTNFEQAREFGRLEGRFLYEAELKGKDKGKDDARSQGNPTPRKQTAAPQPPKHQPRGLGGKFTVPADTDDFAAFDRVYGN